MKNDFISQYKEYHKLDDEWEKKARKEAQQYEARKKYAKYDNKPDNFHGDCDHPNTLENGAATILYIIVMIGGAIFNERWLIWIVATFIYLNFITRHMK